MIPDCLSPPSKDDDDDEVDPLRTTNNENCDSISDESCIYEEEGALNAQIISSADATFIIHTISDPPLTGQTKCADQLSVASVAPMPPLISRRSKTTAVKNTTHTSTAPNNNNKKTIPSTARAVSSSTSSSSLVSSLPPLASAQAQQASTMREVLASIPGFSIKPRRRTNKKMSTAAQIEQTREGCIDLETPDSILCGANLRDLLNKHTFTMLPPFYQYKLVQLLPPVDRPGHADNRYAADTSSTVDGTNAADATNDQSIRLKASSLNNEFFARACLEWRDRLSEGEFTPENQMKLRAEAEREKNKLDPWKLKHFEPIWGCCSTNSGTSGQRSRNTADTSVRFSAAPPGGGRTLRNPLNVSSTITTSTVATSISPSTKPPTPRSTRTVGAVTRSTTASTSIAPTTIVEYNDPSAKLTTPPPMPDLLPIRTIKSATCLNKEDTVESVIIALDDDDDDDYVEVKQSPIEVNNSSAAVVVVAAASSKRAQKRSVTPDIGQGKVGKFSSDVLDCSGGNSLPETNVTNDEPIKMEIIISNVKNENLPTTLPPPSSSSIEIIDSNMTERSIEPSKSEKGPIIIEITSVPAAEDEVKTEFTIVDHQQQLQQPHKSIELKEKMPILSNIEVRPAADDVGHVDDAAVAAETDRSTVVVSSVVTEYSEVVKCEEVVLQNEDMKVVAGELVEVTVPTTTTTDSNVTAAVSDEVESLEPTIQNLAGLVEDDPIEQKFTDAENYVLESGEISADSEGLYKLLFIFYILLIEAYILLT